jgi:hypothetical protein
LPRPNGPWTGALGLLDPPAAPLPANRYLATINDEGPLGIEVEWSRPPRMHAVLPGSLAQRAGVHSGDVLLRVDHVDILDWAPDRVATLFGRRPLKLMLERDEHANAADVALEFDDEDERELEV